MQPMSAILFTTRPEKGQCKRPLLAHSGRLTSTCLLGAKGGRGQHHPLLNRGEQVM